MHKGKAPVGKALLNMTVTSVRRSSSFVSSSSELQEGSKGQLVSSLQRLLKAAGYDVGNVDGDFGPKTEAAVRAFQAANGLSVDGIVGPLTFGKLRQHATPPPRTLGELGPGSRGPQVSALQEALIRKGFDPGPVDGDFGRRTEAAVMAFQRAAGLRVDGVTGPHTNAALQSGNHYEPPRVDPVVTNPSVGGDFRSRILAIAQNEVGNTERSNHNDGSILKYPNAFGRGSEAWCADFVSWVVSKAGGSMNDPYCPSVKNNLIASGNWKGKTNPQPGDLVLFDWDGDRVADHIGIVKSVNRDGSVQTIEGNTGGPGGREGVWERTRHMSSILGFGNPPG